MAGRGSNGLVNDARRLPGSWWYYALAAAILGFGSTQDALRRLSHSEGLSLVAYIVVAVLGTLVLVGSSFVAVAKRTGAPSA